MSGLKKLFPLSFTANDVAGLIKAILIYIVIDIICGAVIGLLAKLPIVGIIFSIAGSLIGLYALAGLIIAILVFLKIVK